MVIDFEEGVKRLRERTEDFGGLRGDDCGARNFREAWDDPVGLEGGGGRREEEDVGARGGCLVGVVYSLRMADQPESSPSGELTNLNPTGGRCSVVRFS